jgi:nucleoside-diphosphate-sugar epimerase
MKILITGVTGRIGANLAKAFIDQGHHVRGLVWNKDRRPNKLRMLDIEVIAGDLVNPNDVQRAVAGVDVICHLGAAFQGGGPFTERDYLDINVQGTFNVLESARTHADHLKHLFFAGTDAAYNKYVPGGMPHPIREDETPMLPKGWYPLSKLLGEDMCLGYHRTYDLPITVFRFALTVAADEILDYRQFYLSHWLRQYENLPGEAPAQVLKQLQSLDNGRKQLLIARDDNGRSYKKHIADVRDITQAFLAALGRSEVIGQVFQLGGPGPYTWEEAVPYMADRLGLDYVDANLIGHLPTFYEFDLTKSKRLLNYRPRFDIFRMIDSAVAFREGNDIGVIPTQVTPPSVSS